MCIVLPGAKLTGLI
uniref:Uncharacterized protein n=1 Tax=Anguilla anguilla TaxID=7936 RepID=A0A0E9T461_ANGAN